MINKIEHTRCSFWCHLVSGPQQQLLLQQQQSQQQQLPDELERIRNDILLLFRQNAQLTLDNSQLRERVGVLENERLQSTCSMKRAKCDVETDDPKLRCEVADCKNKKHSDQHSVKHCNKHRELAEQERKKKHTTKEPRNTPVDPR